MVLNVSEVSCYEKIAPPDIGSGQGIEIIAQETGINPVEKLVAISVRNVHVPEHLQRITMIAR